ncbi:MFS transporter [Streptomyces sp. NPDC055078]
MATPAPPTAPTDQRSATAITVVTSGSVLVLTMLEGMLSPALVDIQNGVGASPASITWVFTGLLLSGSVATPLIGRLADLHDKRKLYLAVLAVVLAGTVMSATATTILALALGQVLQGIGLALFPLVLGILRETQPADRLKNSTGLILSTSSIGGVVGVLVSGPIVEALSYRWLYWLPLGVLTLLWLAALRILPSLPSAGEPAGTKGDSRAAIDWLGAALLTAGLAGLLIALTQVISWGWTSGRFLALSVPSLLLLAVFVAVELRAEYPLVDLRIGGRTVMTACAVVAAIGWATSTASIAVPIIVAAPDPTGYGLASTTTVAGYVLAPLGFAAGVMSIVTGRLEKYADARTILVAACVPIGASSALVLFGHPGPWMLALCSALAGIGIGIGFTQAMNILIASVPAERVASLSGFVFVVKGLGGTLGSQVAGTVLAGDVFPGTPLPTWSSITTAFWIALAVAALATVLSATLPHRTATPAPAVPAEV